MPYPKTSPSINLYPNSLVRAGLQTLAQSSAESRGTSTHAGTTNIPLPSPSPISCVYTRSTSAHVSSSAPSSQVRPARPNHLCLALALHLTQTLLFLRPQPGPALTDSSGEGQMYASVHFAMQDHLMQRVSPQRSTALTQERPSPSDHGRLPDNIRTVNAPRTLTHQSLNKP